jgi:hypothetical protein
MATRNFVPRANLEGGIGTAKKRWGEAYFDKLSVRIIEGTTAQGDLTFAGTRGQTVTHNLGHTNYVVNVSATADTGGDLGDVYVSRAANAFTVYNTGGYRGGARYQIMN